MKLFKTLLILTIVFTNQSYAITMNDFVYRDGLIFKKFTDTPYSGKVEGAEQGYIDSGVRNGEWKFYYANGQIASKGRYQKGSKVGVWEEFDISGNLKSKGSYSNNLKDGSWAIYSNGEFIESHIYKMGRNLTLFGSAPSWPPVFPDSPSIIDKYGIERGSLKPIDDETQKEIERELNSLY